jgi:hypothetical protein
VLRNGCRVARRAAGKQDCDLLRHPGNQFVIHLAALRCPSRSCDRTLIGIRCAFLLGFLQPCSLYQFVKSEQQRIVPLPAPGLSTFVIRFLQGLARLSAGSDC